MDWFRSHHGAPTDPKWISVTKRAATHCNACNAAPVTAAHVVALWWTLLDFGSQQTPRGAVASFDPESAADFLGMDESQVLSILRALGDKGLITDGAITNWAKRQPQREDDSSDRVRAHRERKKAAGDVECNATKRTVTHGNARGDGEERRTEEITTPPPPPASAGDAVTEFLDSLPTTARREWWEREIAGWREGLNLQRPATEADIDAGLRDYLARSDRDYSPKHIRGFVASATRARLQNVIPIGTGPPVRPRPTQPTIAQRAFAVTREAIEDL